MSSAFNEEEGESELVFDIALWCGAACGGRRVGAVVSLLLLAMVVLEASFFMHLAIFVIVFVVSVVSVIVKYYCLRLGATSHLVNFIIAVDFYVVVALVASRFVTFFLITNVMDFTSIWKYKRNSLTHEITKILSLSRCYQRFTLLLYIYIYIYILKWVGPRRDLYLLGFTYYLFLHMCMFPAWSVRQRICMAQGLVNELFNETWTHSCLQLEWFSVVMIFFMKVAFFFFLEYVSLSLLYLICFWYLIRCVCVGVFLNLTNSYFISVYAVNVCLWDTYIYIYIYILYIYMYFCFHFCVCMIHALFNFGLKLSINFFSFIWSSV